MNASIGNTQLRTIGYSTTTSAGHAIGIWMRIPTIRMKTGFFISLPKAGHPPGLPDGQPMQLRVPMVIRLSPWEHRSPKSMFRATVQDIADDDTTPSFSDHTHFGSVDIASGSRERTYTVHNLGNTTLNISGVTLRRDRRFRLQFDRDTGRSCCRCGFHDIRRCLRAGRNRHKIGNGFHRQRRQRRRHIHVLHSRRRLLPPGSGNFNHHRAGGGERHLCSSGNR